MKKTYEKPEIRKVELKPEEAVTACNKGLGDKNCGHTGSRST